MSNINLSGAKAKGSNLSATDCTGTNLEAADLRRASLAGAQLRDANLAIAKLRHANLSQCDLRGAIMRGADLAGAQLTGSLLTDADLTDAVLLDTDLAKADLKKAIGLNQAQIATARGDSKTRLPRASNSCRATSEGANCVESLTVCFSRAVKLKKAKRRVGKLYLSARIICTENIL